MVWVHECPVLWRFTAAPSCNGSMVFQNISNKITATRLGCVTAVNIWRESVVYDELTINESQKQDPEFGQLLNEVRVNCISDKTVALLLNAVIKCTAVEKFQELLGQSLSPVCLFATRKSCDQFNAEMLSKGRFTNSTHALHRRV